VKRAGDGVDKPGMEQLFERLAAAQDGALARPLAPRERVRRRVLWPRLAGAGVLVLALVAVAVSRRAPQGVAEAPDSTGTPTGMLVSPLARETLAAGDSELPLRFEDGSIATFRPGSRGRVLARDARGAEVELLAGQLDAHIVHAERTRWVFRAGPFAVHVTGTRFEVDWSPQTRRLVVSLREGSVTVDGAVLGAGVPLRAGQRLSVALDAQGEAAVRTEAMASPVAAQLVPRANVAAELAPAPTKGEAKGEAAGVAPPDWMALADRGAHVEAWRLAQRAGLPALQRRLLAPGLLALADVARYAGARRDAREIYSALVTRFPGHPLAADAVFSLGRLAFEGNDATGAVRWFGRYIDSWPEGALVSEAMGRLLESSVELGDHARARTAARAYLDRTPEGPYAALARRMLAAGDTSQ
jgi:transmembrane sensor